jgi:hypothetical protein
MGGQILRTTTLVLAFAGAMALTGMVDAAKPSSKGGSTTTTTTTTTETASGSPEFYRVEIDPKARNLLLHGKYFIGGSAGTPEYPTSVTFGGRSVAIDTGSSTIDYTTGEGALVVPFLSLLDALGVGSSGARVIAARKSFEIKVVTAGGTAGFSAYVTRDIKDVPATLGYCPCASAITSNYTKAGLASGPLCSTTQGIDSAEYIEAGYGTSDGNALFIGSHSSWSREPLYTSSCYVRRLSQLVNGVETPDYVFSSPVSDSDHSLCVQQIKTVEPACVVAP